MSFNLALAGHLSSGKSFQLGGMQQRLDYRPVRNDLGDVFDKYVGLLPSASAPTSACPATVIPDRGPRAGKRESLRVRFTDSDHWEDVGSALRPIVAAYCTNDPELIHGDSEEATRCRHRSETVHQAGSCHLVRNITTFSGSVTVVRRARTGSLKKALRRGWGASSRRSAFSDWRR
ncbi:hypothetical protein [Amycolatopsis sp. NPDC004378]